LREILAAFAGLCDAGEAGVLASVVRVGGSTYRRPGARMLVLPGGESLGLISGGCLEGDLLEHARDVGESGRPRLLHYDSSDAGDEIWGLGLGCAGAVDVWLERVSAERPGPLGWLADWTARRCGGAIATALGGPQLGARRALEAGGALQGALAGQDAALARALAEGRGGVSRNDGARDAIARGGAPGAVPRAGEIESDALWIEIARPPLRLVVFGAGPDAAPLLRMARELGWDALVADHRAAFAKPERFPGAEVLHCEAARAVRAARVCAETHCVVMTHHYPSDRTLLRDLLRSEAPYIAALGPKQRTEQLLAELRDEEPRDEERAEPGGAMQARLFAPAGLDIGADSPEQIALAIAAEVQAVAAGRSGGWLRERSGPIHDAAA